MSVSQCQVADWGRVGRADGARGESESHLADYQKDCGKAGIKPNAQAYRQGWDNGIQSFCTAASGWREGLQGHSGKAEVCQGQRGYESFSRYLENGLQVHRTSERMRQNTTETNRLQKRLEESSVSDSEKRRLRDDLRGIDRDQDRLRYQLEQQRRMAP